MRLMTRGSKGRRRFLAGEEGQDDLCDQEDLEKNVGCYDEEELDCCCC